MFLPLNSLAPRISQTNERIAMNMLRPAAVPRAAFLGGLLLATFVPLSVPLLAAPGTVTLMRTPHGGIQPQAVVDAQGVLHLIYFQGNPAHGDIFYVHKKLGADAPFSTPIRVNSTLRSAIAVGTIRGAQLAVGENGCVHVSWNGVGSKGTNGYSRLYVAYARLNDAGTAFEPQRNLLGSKEEVDGGGSVAADVSGHVYVTWHTSPRGKDEAAGGVYLARSTDGGQTFTSGKKISVLPTGQCGCCSMRSFVDHSDVLYVLYRAAGGNFDRDTTLLVSNDGGTTFRSAVLGKWKLGACPMSSFSLAEGEQGVVGAWETAEQVYRASLTADVMQVTAPKPAPGTGSRKYPVFIPNASGETLFAWVEGAGWQRGGSLAWQVYDKDGNSKGAPGRSDGVPAWSLITAVARPDGSFLLVY